MQLVLVWSFSLKVKGKVTQLCPILCDPIKFSREYWVGRLSLLWGIFPTQGLNPGLPHCRWILYQLSHRGSPRILEWVACPFSRGSSRPRNWTGVCCIAGEFFTNWAIREALKFLWICNNFWGILAIEHEGYCFINFRKSCVVITFDPDLKLKFTDKKAFRVGRKF